MKLGIVAAALAVAILGCKEAEDDSSVPQRKSFTFSGAPSAEYAGSWKSGDGLSELNLDATGRLKIIAVSIGQSGRTAKELPGKWAVDGKSLYLEYATNGDNVVLKYGATLEGSKLTLVQEPNKIKTIYQKVVEKDSAAAPAKSK